MAKELYLKQIRNLCLCLLVSGFLNIILVSVLLFWVFQDPYVEEFKPLVKEEHLQAQNALSYYKSLPFDKLIPSLKKTGIIEDGYRERDLALGVLVSFHDFDIEKALKTKNLEKQILTFDQVSLFVYPRLTEEQHEAIYEFAKKEKWPFKAKGLLALLKKEQFKEDSTLQGALFLTPEYATVDALFKGHYIPKQKLIQMLQEGNPALLLAFHEKSGNNLTPETRQKLLLAYLNEGSQTAGQLLLKTDFEFAAKRVSDATALSMIQSLNDSKEALGFLAILSASSRGEPVKSAAKSKYLQVTGKSWEPLVSRETAPVKVEKVVPFPPKPKKELLYIIQDGDSLWKIAKRFNVGIDEIKELNKLKTDSLKPGTPLRVPDHGPQGAKGGISKAS